MVQTTSERSRRHVRGSVTAVLLTLGAIAACDQAFAQITQMGICNPVSQRTEELGCWIVTNKSVGQLPRAPMFWHLDTYATRAAAEAASGPRGTVIEALGKIWLLTIDAAGWRPSAGARVAQIGPLPVTPGTDYTAQYMEAVFTPGMTSLVHRHPGPEAWYTLAGETCLETSEGKTIGRAGGEPVVVPGGLPMHLTATGTETRRAIVLVLHDSRHPAGSPAPDWIPKGLCKQ